MNAVTIDEKELMNLKEINEEYMREFTRGKGKGERP